MCAIFLARALRPTHQHKQVANEVGIERPGHAHDKAHETQAEYHGLGAARPQNFGLSAEGTSKLGRLNILKTSANVFCVDQRKHTTDASGLPNMMMLAVQATRPENCSACGTKI